MVEEEEDGGGGRESGRRVLQTFLTERCLLRDAVRDEGAGGKGEGEDKEDDSSNYSQLKYKYKYKRIYKYKLLSAENNIDYKTISNYSQLK